MLAAAVEPVQQQQQQQQQLPQQKPVIPAPPALITDRKRGKQYSRGAVLGEGGFARCYEVFEGPVKYAAKVIPKTSLKSQKQRSKLYGEINIHRMMAHPNIVKWHEVFEDDEFVYMILEICEGKTLVDMIKKRKRLTEPEVRFYMWQLLGAVKYMHNHRVIHRDLKLGNIFLSRDMNLKIGDFGLAAIIKHDGERKRTICGTPNYIAPEVLFDTNNGHSYEVDIWSLGVIMYTLLIGRPPFQTKDVKAIYKKIKENSYEFPPNLEISIEARSMITSLLHTRPECRPMVENVMEHDFFKAGKVPTFMPQSAAHFPPEFDADSLVMLGGGGDASSAATSSSSSAAAAAGIVDRLPLHNLAIDNKGSRAASTGLPYQKIREDVDNDLVKRSTLRKLQSSHGRAPLPEMWTSLQHHHQLPLVPSNSNQQHHHMPLLSVSSSSSNTAAIATATSSSTHLGSSASSSSSLHQTPLSSMAAAVVAHPSSSCSSPSASPPLAPAPSAATKSTQLVPTSSTLSSSGMVKSGGSSVRQRHAPSSSSSSNQYQQQQQPLYSPSYASPKVISSPQSVSDPPATLTSTGMTKSSSAPASSSAHQDGPTISSPMNSPFKYATTALNVNNNSNIYRGTPVQKQTDSPKLNFRSTVGAGGSSNGSGGNSGSNNQNPFSKSLGSSSSNSVAGSNNNSTSGKSSVQALELMYRNLADGVESFNRNKLAEEAGFRRKSREYDPSFYECPNLFITKWIDYCNKYGLGYQLRDGTVGVYFNDSTSIILAPDNHYFEYLYHERSVALQPGERSPILRKALTMSDYPPDLQKKVTLLKHFKSYMQDKLNKIPAADTGPEISSPSNLDFLTKYLRTKHGVVFRLSNHNVQFNLFDHTKIILSRDGLRVTYINKKREVSTWPLLEALHCSGVAGKEIVERIKFCRDVLHQMIAKKQKNLAAASSSSNKEN